MSDRKLQELLSEDFEQARRRLERDGFSERVLRKLAARRGGRLAIVSFAGAAGAGFASAQFVKMTGLFSAAKPLLDNALVAAAPFGLSADAPYQFLAAATLAIGFAATAFILQSDI